MHNRFFVCILVSFMVVPSAIAQPDKTKTETAKKTPIDANPSATASVEALRAELKKARVDWAKHRSQEIVVLKIDGLKGKPNQGEKKALERRLETLQNKKISNREWATYWRLESQYAENIARLYRELAPIDGTSLLKVEQDKKKRAAEAAAIISRTKDDALQKASQALSTAEAGVRALMNSNAEATRTSQERLDELSDTLEKTGKRVSKIDEKLNGNPSERKRDTLMKAKVSAAQELNGLEAQLAEVKANVETLTATQEVISKVLQGESIPTDGLTPVTVNTLRLFVDGRLNVASAQAKYVSAQDQARMLEDESTRARLEFERFSARHPALDMWAKLAKKKVKNQALYYDAISADIAAVNDRLRSVRKTEKQAESIHSGDVCDADLKDEETQYAHFRDCTRAIHEELRTVSAEFEQAKQQRKLSTRLVDSVAQLIKAQVVDVTLVNEEESISKGEAERSMASKTETAEWRALWGIYRTRSAKKQAQLAEALKESKVS